MYEYRYVYILHLGKHLHIDWWMIVAHQDQEAGVIALLLEPETFFESDTPLLSNDGCWWQVLIKTLKYVKSGDSWMYPYPNVPRHGKSLYKPYITWVFIGYNPQESQGWTL